MVQSVSEDETAIGYSGIGYLTSNVRAVPLAEKEGMPYKEASQQNADDGSYPLWRHLYLYVNKAPDKPLDPIVGEFIKFIYSKEGQLLAVKDGFFPLKAEVIEKELKKLD